MLTADQLTELYRRHRDQRLLSVYLDTDQNDFAERGKWRTALRNATSRERDGVDDPDAFDRALGHLTEVLTPGSNHFLEGRGWVGFATPDERLYAEALPVPMPNLVRWEAGIRVAPYARALKQARPVITVLVDSRKGRVLRYVQGELTEVRSLRADTRVGDLTDVNVAKRATDRSGVRGKTGTDAAQRFLDVERDRMVSKVAEAVKSEAGRDGVVVAGGSERTVNALLSDLSDLGDERLRVAQGLSFDLSDAELREIVEATATEISADEGERIVETLLEAAAPGGDACLGDEDTEQALRERRVRLLVVADTLRASSPDRTDHLEGAAWEQGARVIEVSGEAAARLGGEAGGVGALLRYRLPPSEDPA